MHSTKGVCLFLLAAGFWASLVFTGEVFAGDGQSHSSVHAVPRQQSTEIELTDTLESEQKVVLKPGAGVPFPALASVERDSSSSDEKYSDYPWVNSSVKMKQCLRRKRSYFESDMEKIVYGVCAAPFTVATLGGLVTTGAACSMIVKSCMGVGVTLTDVYAFAVGGGAFISGTLLGVIPCLLGMAACKSYEKFCRAGSFEKQVQKIYACNHESCMQIPSYSNIPYELQCAGNEGYLLRYPVMILGSDSMYSLEYILELVETKEKPPGYDNPVTWKSIAPWHELGDSDKKRIISAYKKSTFWARDQAPIYKLSEV